MTIKKIQAEIQECFDKFGGGKMETEEQPNTDTKVTPELQAKYDELKDSILNYETPMTTRELSEFIGKNCNSIVELFVYKNQDYGQKNDAFSNFRKTAQRIIIPFMTKRGVSITEREAMFLVAQVLQDKHLVGLSQTGLNGNEVEERLLDVATYSLIMKAIKERG